MNLIGHRGVAGLELENTRTSFIRAVRLGLPAVELDVRKTKDDKLVVCHDDDLERIAHRPEKIKDLKLRNLQKIELIDGSHIITLKDALKILKDTHAIIEMKDTGCARELMKVLDWFPNQHISIASFKLQELVLYRELNDSYDYYALEHTKPFDIIHLAKALKLNGIGLNFWLLNPLTYQLSKRAGLKIYVYTLNNKFIARLISILYPSVAICTDHPEWFLEPENTVDVASA